MSETIISIITPIYNAEKQLPKMLSTVIAQTYVNWELILVNDGSTDSSLAIIEAHAHEDERIRVFTQANAGPSVARNVGIQHSKGKYLTFIDADDWVEVDWLERLLDAMTNFDVDLVCAGYYEVNPKFPKGLKLHDFEPHDFDQIIDRKSFQSNLFNGVSGVLWGKLFKRAVFQGNKILLHPDLKLSEDLLAVLEYSLHIQNVYVLPDALYYYNRLDEEGLSGTFNIQKYENLELFFKEVRLFEQELPFLDLSMIENKRKYAFMIQLLMVNAPSKNDYKQVAQYLYEKEHPVEASFYQNNRIFDHVLQSVFDQKYFKSWCIIKGYLMLKKIKNA